MNSYNKNTPLIDLYPSIKLNAQVFELSFPFLESFAELLDKETLSQEERQTLQMLWSDNIVRAWFKGVHFVIEENGTSRNEFLNPERLVVVATQLLKLSENAIFNEVWESNQEIFQTWLGGQYDSGSQFHISKEEALEFFKFALVSNQINVLNVMLDNNPYIKKAFAKDFLQDSAECQSLLTVLMLILSTANEEIIIKFLNLNTQFKDLLSLLANDPNYSDTLLRCIMLTNTSDWTDLMTYYLSVVNDVKPIIQVLADCLSQQTFVYHQIYALLNRLKELHANVDSIDLSGDLKDCFNNVFSYGFPKKIFEEITDDDLKCFLIRMIILSGNIANINELQRFPINGLPAIVWYKNNARLDAGERENEFLNVNITETFSFPRILTSDTSSPIPLRIPNQTSHRDLEQNLVQASKSANQRVTKLVNYMLPVEMRSDSIVISNEEFSNLMQDAKQFVNELINLKLSPEQQAQLQIEWKNNILLRALFQGQAFCIVDEGILSEVRRIDFDLVLKAIEATINLEDIYIQNDILQNTYFYNRNGDNLILKWLKGTMIVDGNDHSKYYLTDQECKDIFLKLVQTNHVNLLPILLQNTFITEWLISFKDSQSESNMEEILLFMFKHANSELLERFLVDFPNFHSLLRKLASDSNYTHILLDALMDGIRSAKFVEKYLNLFSDVRKLQTFRNNYRAKRRDHCQKITVLSERIEYLLSHPPQRIVSHDNNKKRKPEVENESQHTKKTCNSTIEKVNQSNFSTQRGSFFYRQETSLQHQKTTTTSQTVNAVIEQPQVAVQTSSSESVLANAIKTLVSNPSRVVTNYMQSISKAPCPKPADIPRLGNKVAGPQHKESSILSKPYRGN